MEIKGYLGRQITYHEDKDKKISTILGDEFFFDFSKFEHFGFFAKSGGGKSYSAGDILEEAIKTENNLFGTIFITPVGNIATMRIPNKTGEIERWNKEIKKNDVEPMGFDRSKLKLLIPAECIGNFDPLMFDEVFSISAKNLTEDLLCYAFGMQPLDNQVSLYRKIKRNFDRGGNEYNLNDIINEINITEYHSQTKESLTRKLEALESLGLISENAPEVYDLIQPGKAIAFDLSMSSEYTNRIIVNFFAKKLMYYRNLITSKINLAKIKLELEEENWKQFADWYLPPVRLIIDEAHEFLPNNHILRSYIKKGRNLGCVLGFISQSADLTRDSYANLSHLFIGPMRFDEDITTLRSLTGTERSYENFKKLVKSQGNGCFLYYNTNKLYSEKVIQFRPRCSLHPSSNCVENEKKYLIISDEDNNNEDLEKDLLDFLGKKVVKLEKIPNVYSYLIPKMIDSGILRSNGKSVVVDISKLRAEVS